MGAVLGTQDGSASLCVASGRRGWTDENYTSQTSLQVEF